MPITCAWMTSGAPEPDAVLRYIGLMNRRGKKGGDCWKWVGLLAVDGCLGCCEATKRDVPGFTLVCTDVSRICCSKWACLRVFGFPPCFPLLLFLFFPPLHNAEPCTNCKELKTSSVCSRQKTCQQLLKDQQLGRRWPCDGTCEHLLLRRRRMACRICRKL